MEFHPVKRIISATFLTLFLIALLGSWVLLSTMPLSVKQIIHCREQPAYFNQSDLSRILYGKIKCYQNGLGMRASKGVKNMDDWQACLADQHAFLDMGNAGIASVLRLSAVFLAPLTIFLAYLPFAGLISSQKRRHWILATLLCFGFVGGLLQNWYGGPFSKSSTFCVGCGNPHAIYVEPSFCPQKRAFIEDIRANDKITFPMLVIALRNVEAIG